MASEPRTTTVQILGHELRIRTTESPEFVQEVERYVDDTLRSIAGRLNQGTPAQVAILGALNIAEELFRERRDGKGRKLSAEVQDRMRALLDRLEQIAPEEAARVPKPAVARSAGARG